MKLKPNNVDILSTKMHFRISGKSNFDQIQKCISSLICNLEKHKNDRNAWKFNVLNKHWSFELPIKYIAQLNNLYKLPIAQPIAQFL